MTRRARKKTVGIVCFIVIFFAAAIYGGHFGTNYMHRNAKSSDTVKAIAADSAQQIAEEIISNVKLSGIVKLENEQIRNYYSVPMDIIRNAVVYKSTSATTADEIAVFWVKDKGTAGIVRTAIDGRIAECRSAYSTLSTEENRKVENCLIVSSGEYMIMVICGDTKTAGEAISEFYQ